LNGSSEGKDKKKKKKKKRKAKLKKQTSSFCAASFCAACFSVSLGCSFALPVCSLLMLGASQISSALARTEAAERSARSSNQVHIRIRAMNSLSKSLPFTLS